MLGVAPTWPGYGFPRVEQWQCATPPSWLHGSRVLTADRHAEWTTPDARRPAARTEDRARDGVRSRIGRGLALALADDGWTIVVFGRRIEPLDEPHRAAGWRRLRHSIQPTSLSQRVRVIYSGASWRRTAGLISLFNYAGSSSRPLPIDRLPYEQRHGGPGRGSRVGLSVLGANHRQ